MTTWRFLGLAERLVQYRRTQQITSVEIARKAGISPQTLHLIEKGKVMPSMETLERIAKATKLDPGWLGFGVAANGQAPHITVVPGFECDSLIADLLAILRGKTGVIDDVYKYLDSTGAHEWRSLLKQPEFSAVIAAFPMQELIDFLAEIVPSDESVDVVGLGCGTAEREITVIKKLLAKRRRDLRLLLLDISINLLSSAVHASDEFSRLHSVPLMALLGNFHNLPEYAHLLTGDFPRRRIVTMFGFTFSNLDNEVQFLRRSMGWVNDGDLLVLDLPAAAVDSTKPDEIVRRDKTLARKRAGDWQSAAYRFLTGPLRRNLDLISSIKIETELDQASCVIPGSYAIMNNTRVQLQSGEVKQFVTGFSKRYVTEKLAAHLQGEGWTFLRGFCYGPDNFGMVVVFRREQPRKRRGAFKK